VHTGVACVPVPVHQYNRDRDLFKEPMALPAIGPRTGLGEIDSARTMCGEDRNPGTLLCFI
jgi:hypothetical protein